MEKKKEFIVVHVGTNNQKNNNLKKEGRTLGKMTEFEIFIQNQGYLLQCIYNYSRTSVKIRSQI